jgi:hypothetical protein
MLKKILLFTLLMSCVFSSNALAKWWIFGQSEETVATSYLYLNDISFNELDEQVTLYRDMLPGGRVILRGKAQSGKSRIGKVEVSLDKKETWQPAAKSADGSFEFSFIPELNRTYPLYVKILDTSGKSNEVDETFREITVSNADISALVRQALDAMVRAYQEEEPRSFMAYVDANFAGDAVVLDRAIRKDFTAFDALHLTYTLNNVASGAKGKVFVALSYNRQVTSARSGGTLTDRGLTEFIFNLTAGKAKVSAMKQPLLFGLSEASEVATGIVNSGENDEILILDETGNLRIGPVGDDAIGASSIPALTNLRVIDAVIHHSYSFAFDFPIDSMANDLSIIYDIVLEEALTPTGPWTEVFREHYWDPRFHNVTTTHIASSSALLYYRAKVESQSTHEQSLPTNVVMVDNR